MARRRGRYEVELDVKEREQHVWTARDGRGWGFALLEINSNDAKLRFRVAVLVREDDLE